MLTFQNVTAGYGRQNVLNGVSFSLKPHKLTAVIGKNGCGKSTLLACLNRQIEYEGRVLYDGRDVAGWKARERARLLAILPQTLAAPSISVGELVAFGRNPYLDLGKRLSEADQRMIRDALQIIGIENMRDKYVNHLSGGERQKAYLAMVLAQNTPVMALDEPTTYMDMEYETAFFRLLKALQEKRGITLLAVLHNLTQAVRYADYLAVLDQGRICFYGTPAECCQSGIVESIFHVRAYTCEQDGEKHIFFA